MGKIALINAATSKDGADIDNRIANLRALIKRDMAVAPPKEIQELARLDRALEGFQGWKRDGTDAEKSTG